jgi:hypothetical protein
MLAGLVALGLFMSHKLEATLRLNSAPYDRATLTLTIRNTTDSPIRLSDTITPGRGVTLRLLSPGQKIEAQGHPTNTGAMLPLEFSDLSPGQTKAWTLKWPRCFRDAKRPEVVRVIAEYNVDPFLTTGEESFDVRFASAPLLIKVSPGKVSQAPVRPSQKKTEDPAELVSLGASQGGSWRVCKLLDRYGIAYQWEGSTKGSQVSVQRKDFKRARQLVEADMRKRKYFFGLAG